MGWISKNQDLIVVAELEKSHVEVTAVAVQVE
jgi:hypothetical protein